jgi:hypothetical protein
VLDTKSPKYLEMAQGHISLSVWFFEFYEVEDPEHIFGKSKCPLTYYVLLTYNSLSHIT